MMSCTRSTSTSPNSPLHDHRDEKHFDELHAAPPHLVAATSQGRQQPLHEHKDANHGDELHEEKEAPGRHHPPATLPSPRRRPSRHHNVTPALRASRHHDGEASETQNDDLIDSSPTASGGPNHCRRTAPPQSCWPYAYMQATR